MKKTYWKLVDQKNNKIHIFRTLEELTQFFDGINCPYKLSKATIAYQLKRSKKKICGKFDFNQYDIKKINIDELNFLKEQNSDQLIIHSQI